MPAVHSSVFLKKKVKKLLCRSIGGAAFFVLFLPFFACHVEKKEVPNSSAQSIFEAVCSEADSRVAPFSTAQKKRVAELIAAAADPLQPPPFDSVDAARLHKLGSDLIEIDGGQASSRACFEAALAVRQRLYPSKPMHKDIARSLHNIGLSYEREAFFSRSLEYYLMADVPEYRVYPNGFFLNLTRMGRVRGELGESEAALRCFSRAFDFADSSAIAAALFSEAFAAFSSCLRQFGHRVEAISAAQKGIEKCGGTDESAVLFWALSNVWQDSGAVAKNDFEQKAAYKKAISFGQKAFETESRAAHKLNIAGNLGELYRRSHDFSNAQKTLETALVSSEKAGADADPLAVLQLRTNLGEVFLDQKKPQLALFEFEKSMAAIASMASDSSKKWPAVSNSVGSPVEKSVLLSDLAAAHLALAPIEKKPEHLTDAARAFDSLFALTNRLRGELMSDEAKIRLAQQSAKWSRSALGGCLDLWRASGKDEFLDRAFQLAEQGKAFALLEAVRLRSAAASLPDDLRERQRDVLEKVAEAQTDAEKAAADQAERLFLKELEQKAPAYFSLKYRGADASRAAIEAILEPDQALVEFVVADSSLLVFVLQKGKKLRVAESKITKKALAEKAADFQKLLLESRSAADEKAFCKVGFELFEALFGSIEADLPARLVIVPDGPLAVFSFEALPAARAESVAELLKNEKFAVHRWAISHSFSANLLLEMRSRPAPSGFADRLAVFAPAGNEADPMREANEIARKTARAELFQPAASTKKQFFESCRSSRFAHVAAHGFLSQKADSSRIVFADEPLFLRELYAHELGQDFIAFSACRTAAGRVVEGEGAISLARGLAFAGVRSFAAALWDVPTDGKAAFLPDFYERFLEKGEPRDLALAAAKRQFLKNPDAARAPKNWAGIALFGASGPPETGEKGWLFWIFGGLTAAILIFLAKKSRSLGDRKNASII